MEDIVLSRGVIAKDGQTANDLYKWMSQVHKPFSGDREVNSSNLAAADRGAEKYRSELTIKMLDRTGTVVRAWKLYHAFPVNFVPGSDLNAAEDGEKSLEQLTLTYEDFEELSVVNGAVGTTAL
jgi:phage tail-like protein